MISNELWKTQAIGGEEFVKYDIIYSWMTRFFSSVSLIKAKNMMEIFLFFMYLISIPDCKSKEDEPPTCKTQERKCSDPDHFRCNNGKCIPKRWRCDYDFGEFVIIRFDCFSNKQISIFFIHLLFKYVQQIALTKVMNWIAPCATVQSLSLDVLMVVVYRVECNAMENTTALISVTRKIATSLVPQMNSNVLNTTFASRVFGFAMVRRDSSIKVTHSRKKNLLFSDVFIHSGDNDCANGADETNCTCDQNQFQCSGDGRCIENRWRCGMPIYS